MQDRIEELVAEAEQARARAYCPYSGFHVGAAILTATGRIVGGCNVENSSFGLTICAERTAMCRAVAEQAGRPVGMVLVTDASEPVSPCGACRQFLFEFNPDLEIVSFGGDGTRRTYSLRDLLPDAFDGGDLPR